MKRSTWIVMAVCAAVSVARAASADQQSFAVEPVDTSAVVDSTASLPCRVKNLAGQLQWTKDDFALGTNRNLSYHGYPRYAMTGSDENGEYDLKLSPVTLDDEGTYQCQVGTGKRDEPAIRSEKAKLTILVPPSHPRILQGESVVTAENVPLELECVSDGGKPPAEIIWVDDVGNTIVDGIKTYIEATATDSRRFTTKSVLKFVPKMEHHNTSIRCQAYNSAVEKKSLQTKVRLHVKFAPKISLTIGGPARKLVEGSDVKFVCLTKANPPEVTYRWFVNDQFALGEVTSELWLINITRRLHNSFVRCEAQNSVDKTEESKALNILYKPQFKTRPRNVQADYGSHVSIVCDVDSNPPASIEWTFEKTKKVMSSTSNLTVHVSAASAGKYYCKATSPGFGEVNAEATVLMKSPPVIHSPRAQYGSPSDTVRLECVALSVPVADKILWSYQGTIVGTRNDQNYYSVLEDPTDGGVRSTLIIRNSRHEQFGAYNCTASNYYGSDSIEITLTPKRDFTLALAVLCVGVGIVVVVITLSVVRFCRHSSTSQKKKIVKTAAGEYGVESVADNKTGAAKESDASSNVSDIKMETGSSLSYRPYKIDYGGTVPDCTMVGDNAADANNVGGGAAGGQTTTTTTGLSRVCGIPLAGPVPVGPCYSSAGYPSHQQNGNEYADPLNYASRYDYNNSDVSSSNGYIVADRLYDLNPSLTRSSLTLDPDAKTAAAARNGGVQDDPTALLRYSAAYGNPYLRPNPAQWLVKTKRKPDAVTAAGPIGPNYHIGVAKRQTLATHV